MSIVDDLRRVTWTNPGALIPVIKGATDTIARVGSTVKTAAETYEQARALIASYSKSHKVSEAEALAALIRQGVVVGTAANQAQASLTSPLPIVGAVLILILVLRR